MKQVTVLSLGFSNAFLIQDKGLALVDTGMNVSKARYSRLFSQLKIDPRDIGLIIISHGHPDHFANAQELKEITGAPVLCHKNAVEALYSGHYPEVIPRNEAGKQLKKLIKGMPFPAHQRVYPDLTVDDSFDLYKFGINGRIVYTPGHTDCSISVILNSGEAIVGDILFTSPFTGKLTAAVFANDEEALFTSVKRLAKTASLFYGGHGGPYHKEDVMALLSNTSLICQKKIQKP